MIEESPSSNQKYLRAEHHVCAAFKPESNFITLHFYALESYQHTDRHTARNRFFFLLLKKKDGQEVNI